MKKVVITVVAVGFAAVAASAQNLADARFTAECMRGVACARAQKATATASSKPAKKDGSTMSWFKRIEQEQVRVARLAQEQAAQTEQTAKAEEAAEQPAAQKPAAKPQGLPSYYYGREGHIMALSDATVEALKAEPAPAKPAKKAKAKKKSEGCWFTRMMGFDKYENETEEEWQARLTSMAMK